MLPAFLVLIVILAPFCRSPGLFRFVYEETAKARTTLEQGGPDGSGFKIVAPQFTSLPFLPGSRYGHAMAASRLGIPPLTSDGRRSTTSDATPKVYMHGGRREGNVLSAGLWTYDADDSKWSFEPPMISPGNQSGQSATSGVQYPGARYFHNMHYDSNGRARLRLFGGKGDCVHNTTGPFREWFLRDLWDYCTVDKTWSYRSISGAVSDDTWTTVPSDHLTVPRYPESRALASTWLMESDLYVWGGYRMEGSTRLYANASRMWTFWDTSSEWTYVNSTTHPPPCAGHIHWGDKYGGSMYIFGGEAACGNPNEIWYFGDGSWTLYLELPGSRASYPDYPGSRSYAPAVSLAVDSNTYALFFGGNGYPTSDPSGASAVGRVADMWKVWENEDGGELPDDLTYPFEFVQLTDDGDDEKALNAPGSYEHHGYPSARMHSAAVLAGLKIVIYGGLGPGDEADGCVTTNDCRGDTWVMRVEYQPSASNSLTAAEIVAIVVPSVVVPVAAVVCIVVIIISVCCCIAKHRKRGTPEVTPGVEDADVEEETPEANVPSVPPAGEDAVQYPKPDAEMQPMGIGDKLPEYAPDDAPEVY